MTADLTPAEAAVVARFDNTPDAPEALRERVAAALYAHEAGPIADWAHEPDMVRHEYRGLADAALAVLTTGALR